MSEVRERHPSEYEKGDFAALSAPGGWETEVRRLRRAGNQRAGWGTVACPKCWHPVGIVSRKPSQCCGQTFIGEEIGAALGLTPKAQKDGLEWDRIAL